MLLAFWPALSCQLEETAEVEDASGSAMRLAWQPSARDAASWSAADARSESTAEPLDLWSLEVVSGSDGETRWRATLDDRLVAGEQLRDGTRIRLPHPDGRALEGVVSSAMAHPIGTSGWIAHLEEDQGGRVVAAWAHRRWMFGYWVPGEDTRWTFVQEAESRVGWFEKRDATDHRRCGGVVDVGVTAHANPRGSSLGDADRLRAKMGGLHRIDVLIPYTEAAAAWAQANEGSIEHTATAAITLGNDAMANSLIDLRFRALKLAPQTDAEGDLRENLEDLRVVGNGFMDEVPPLRDAIGADLVALFARYGSEGGLAFRPSALPLPDAAWSVNRVQQLSWTYTLVHEMAHNLGSAHSRLQVQEPASASGGLHPWSVGWYWQGPSGPESSVMAYPMKDPDDGTVWAQHGYFSNPDVLRNEPAGTDDAMEDGGPANNARSLNDAAPIVAGYRDALEATVAVVGEGSAEPDGTFFVGRGADLEVELTPADGWQLAEIRVNDALESPVSPLVLRDVQDEVEVEVVFRQEQAISFPRIPRRHVDDGPFPLDATASSGLVVSFGVSEGPADIVDGDLVPTAPGLIAVVATQDGDARWMPAEPVEQTFDVVTERAAVVAEDLEVDYRDAPQWPTVRTDPPGLEVEITWADREEAPTLPGSWAFTADVVTPGYVGSTSGTFVIRPLEAEIVIRNDEVVYTGSAQGPEVVTVPEGLSAVLVWEGRDEPPTDAGTYPLSVRVDDPVYAGDASGVFTIRKAQATVTLGLLRQEADGMPRAAMVETTPARLDVRVLYNGDTQPPRSVGTWTVHAEIVDDNWKGEATGELELFCPPAPCVEGERSCEIGRRYVVACTVASWGCLENAAEQSCSAVERCENAVCTPLCEDTCSLGELTCNEGRPAACATGSLGCLQWQPKADCDDDQTCSDEMCALECVSCERGGSGTSGGGCAAAGSGGNPHAGWVGLLVLLAWQQRRRLRPRHA